ncbi:pirin family protein [Acinetobacter guerrae]|uniref:pirin family protein n=1 Tax=Acinetobacter guerrae TaxID=1843371 RepID=UPI00125FE6A1|nr:pirin family protein [Acinetobacter guerrae]MPW44208.1 quercetin 2,3-dioxygenase [Acinetobacter guerrae]
MTNTNYTEISDSQDCESYINQFIQDFQIRSAEIGKGTVIKRALPSRQKRMIGAWCFLDHAGPVTFPQGDGLDVGPHPHTGLQTFTWMIEGTMMHTDSLGTKQLIRPYQVNLMTAGHGISHTEVAPDSETKMHAAQLWIALPDDKLNMPPQFDHYPELPKTVQDQVEFTVLVGEFMGQNSPVAVHTPLVGVDMTAQADSKTLIPLNPEFEYGFLALDGHGWVNGHELNQDNLVVLEPGLEQIEVEIPKGHRILLIGGKPFETPILLWWNLVGRTTEGLREAREQWVNHDARFGEIPDYDGPRLEAPTFPDQMRASK